MARIRAERGADRAYINHRQQAPALGTHDGLIQDIRYAVRAQARRALAAVSIVTLAWYAPPSSRSSSTQMLRPLPITVPIACCWRESIRGQDIVCRCLTTRTSARARPRSKHLRPGEA